MPDQARDFRVVMMYHPSHHVTDLADAEAFFQEVFGRSSTPLSTLSRDTPPREGHPTDYSTFTPIQDVLFDTIDPKRYVLLGKQRYPTVTEPHLKGFGWYVEGMPELYRALRHADITIIDQVDEIAVGDEMPTAAGSPMPLFFSVPENVGLRYEFFPLIAFPLDPRVAPDWQLAPPSDGDALGIERCSHHTVLTSDPHRALRLVVDVLGGEIIHEGRDEVVGARATFVFLGDGVLEYAEPDRGTFAHADLQRDLPNDTYHAITWKVADLDRVERRLAAKGIGIRQRTDTALVTDPATSLGVPWAFSTSLVPGDPRTTG